MKYRLAGASYRAIAEKLTEDRAQAYADEHGVSFERAMKQLPHVSKRNGRTPATATACSPARASAVATANASGVRAKLPVDLRPREPQRARERERPVSRTRVSRSRPYEKHGTAYLILCPALP